MLIRMRLSFPLTQTRLCKQAPLSHPCGAATPLQCRLHLHRIDVAYPFCLTAMKNARACLAAPFEACRKANNVPERRQQLNMGVSSLKPRNKRDRFFYCNLDKFAWGSQEKERRRLTPVHNVFSCRMGWTYGNIYLLICAVGKSCTRSTRTLKLCSFFEHLASD